MSPLALTLAPLASGDGRPVVVLDFDSFGADRTLAHLLRTDPRGHAMHGLDVVHDLADSVSGCTMDDLASGYADLLESTIGAPSTLVSFCSAATLALRITERLNDGGGGRDLHRLVLVEPTWVDDARFEEAVVSVRDNLQVPQGAPLPDMSSLPALLDGLKHDVAEMLAEDEDLDEGEREFISTMLVTRYRAWFHFLLEARSVPVPAPGPWTTLLVSRAGGRGLPSDWQPESVREIRLSAEPGAILADTELADSLFALV